MDVKIEPSWKEALKNEFTKPYFLEIVTFLKIEKNGGRRNIRFLLNTGT